MAFNSFKLCPVKSVAQSRQTVYVQEAAQYLCMFFCLINPVALRKAKIVYNFGLSGCSRDHFDSYIRAPGKQMESERERERERERESERERGLIKVLGLYSIL